MKKKAKQLQEIAVYLRQMISETDAHNEGNSTSIDVRLSLESDEARAMVEALESLRWVNLRVHPADYIKHGHTYFTSLGIFYKDAEQALRIGKEAGLETIGVIELKDNEQ